MWIMKASGPFPHTDTAQLYLHVELLISFCFLLFHKIVLLFLCTFSFCFQLLQSLLKYVPITFSFFFFQVKDNQVTYTSCTMTSQTVVDVLGHVHLCIPCSARNPAFPWENVHQRVGVGGSLRDGFFQLAHFPDENSENSRGKMTGYWSPTGLVAEWKLQPCFLPALPSIFGKLQMWQPGQGQGKWGETR